MTTSRLTRWWPLFGLIAFIVAVAGALAIGLVAAGGDQDVVGLVFSIASAVVVPMVTGTAAALWRRHRGAIWESAAAVGEAANALADAEWDLWRGEAGERRLHAPAPIAVRWVWTRHPVTGSVEEAVYAAAVPRRFAALPGVGPVGAEAVEAGDLSDLFTVYGGLNSGRIVILGGPGSGKSATALLVLLEALQHRRSLHDPAVRATVPVPVLLTTHGWDPSRQDLVRWLAGRIVADFPGLWERSRGLVLVTRLIREGGIALFLDGFDELPPALRADALRAINAAPQLRLVLLTRSAELVDATRAEHLYGAAALELCPVPADTAAEYLLRIQVRPTPPPWGRLAEYLRTHPDSVLAQALDSPLMLTLLRDTFSNPDEVDRLLTPGRFGTRAAVEDHLLARVLPNAYWPAGRPAARYRLGKAERWLGHLAAGMTRWGTRDLAWWRLPEWAPASVRVLVTGLGGILVGVVHVAAIQLSGELGRRSTPNPVVLVAAGLVFGLTAGLAAEIHDARVAGTGRPAGSRSGLAAGVAAGIVVGLVGGIHINTRYGFVPALTFGLGAGLTAGVTTAIVAGRGQRAHAGRHPHRGIGAVLRAALVDGFAAGLASGLPVGLVIGLSTGLASGLPAGLVNGLVTGLVFGVAFALMDGLWAVPLGNVVAASPMSMWRQDLRRSLLTGTAFGAALGLYAGLDSTITTARLHPLGTSIRVGMLIALAVGSTTMVGATVMASRAWRTQLLFGQLWIRGLAPLRGLRFLEDARRLGIMREVGPVYQFRHGLLQDRLAREASALRPPPGRLGWRSG